MKCTGKEWDTCRVEKMGCTGCYYNKVKVGDYIRTENGKIDKVVNNNYYIQKYIECENGIYLKENIVKHSKYIINLIEPGDYVNGSIVNDINNDEYDVHGKYDWVTKKGIHLECGDEEGCIAIENNEIKSIVTHEQFESVSYEV